MLSDVLPAGIATTGYAGIWHLPERMQRTVVGKSMVIRKEQMDAFSEPLKSGFEDRMVAHLNRFFPRQCAVLRPEELRRFIRQGCDGAGRYGIRIERDVCKFIDLMFCLSVDFDRNPRYPWAWQILSEWTTDPTAKVNRLHRKAVEHLSKV
ncbi:MAG TPA: hypothetical protein VKU01_09490 [Bryobacteraceae bacterium]|nr:hypothetical protein [Bryobacteraceae bacterium]